MNLQIANKMRKQISPFRPMALSHRIIVLASFRVRPLVPCYGGDRAGGADLLGWRVVIPFVDRFSIDYLTVKVEFVM